MHVAAIDTGKAQRHRPIDAELRQRPLDGVVRLRHPEHPQPAQRRQDVVSPAQRTQDRLPQASADGVVRLFAPESPQGLRTEVCGVEIGGERLRERGVWEGLSAVRHGRHSTRLQGSRGVAA
ncbi:hypothetical protein GCM10010455_17380 [Microbacterium esteraromaticum]